MNKKIFFVIYVIIMLVILMGCSNPGNNDEVSFIATVLENNKTYLLVEPKENSSELNSADQIIISVSEATLLNSQDKEINITDIETGKKVQIFYDGQIAESYPAQIKQCYRIKVLE